MYANDLENDLLYHGIQICQVLVIMSINWQSYAEDNLLVTWQTIYHCTVHISINEQVDGLSQYQVII
jgi:hypothetical protein